MPSPDNSSGLLWRFGQVEFNELTQELRVSGKLVPLERKPLDVLVYLLRHAGEVVTKNDLLDNVWPGRVVVDAATTVAIGKIRQAISDESQTLIKTLHGHGYRLVAPVSCEQIPRVSADAAANENVEHGAIGESLPAALAQLPERRQITAVSCSIYDATNTFTEADPETYHNLALKVLNLAEPIISKYQGTLAKTDTDGLLFFFGYPVASEDVAERAVRTALEIREACRALAANSVDPVSISFGVHTGTTVINAANEEHEPLAFGPMLNRALHIRTTCKPGEICISSDTRKLIHHRFHIAPAQAGANVGPTQGIYQVLGLGKTLSPLESAAHLSPFIGRGAELEFVANRWALVLQRRGQALLLQGEPGIGKSRLIFELRKTLTSDPPPMWLETKSSSLTQNNAYQPIATLFEKLLPQDADRLGDKVTDLEQALIDHGLDLKLAVPLLFPIFDLPVPSQYSLPAFSPELTQRKTAGLLVQWLLVAAQRNPLVLMIEDLHWTDPSTAAFLTRLTTQIQTASILILMTSRPEFVATPLSTHATVLKLEALQSQNARLLLDTLLDDKIARPIKERIAARSDGIPLFLEEMAKALVESHNTHEATGSPELLHQDFAIPITLQDLLTARLDRQGEARITAQTASVIGPDFSYALLAQLTDLDHSTLQSHLHRLVSAGLLFETGIEPEMLYTFKHALIRDAAYNSLLKDTRRKLHGRIASLLEKQFPIIAKTKPELLALHHENAGNLNEAVKYYRRAAVSVQGRAAIQESLAYATAGLRLLYSLPADSVRSRNELTLLIVQVHCLSITKGYANPETQAHLNKLQPLLGDTADPPHQAKAMGYLWASNHFLGKPNEALTFSQKLVAYGNSARVPVLTCSGHAWNGWSLFALARHAEAEQNIQTATQFADLRQRKAFASMGGVDPVSSALCTSAYTRWHLGFPDQALCRAHEALKEAQKIGDPHNSCMAHLYGPMATHLIRKEPAPLIEYAKATIALCEQYGYAEGYLAATRNLEVGLCMLSKQKQNLDRLRGHLADQESAQSFASILMDLGHYSELCIELGCYAEAHRALEKALSLSERFGQPYWLPELQRLMGELVLADGNNDKQTHAATSSQQRAQDYFLSAIEIAKRQGARSLELRAAMGLARLWKLRNRRRDAHALLQSTYMNFIEGFETPDLKAAHALLASLC